ncbi:MAG: toll/interleukin-1 receptor domain-containing protein [Planctomycetes bacterium]|nr:toll/interleukin-1 receptor domain-containing protein [Planctomycetota bacterium]
MRKLIMGWDVFISYASEDRDVAAMPIKAALEAAGVSVWMDKEQVGVGAGIRHAIDIGLGHSKHGVVILSPRFFNKAWTQQELDALFMKHISSGQNVLLPVVLDMTAEEVGTKSRLVAGMNLLFLSDGLDKVVAALVSHVRGGSPPEPKPVEIRKAAHPDAAELARIILVTLQDGRQFFFNSNGVRTTAAVVCAEIRPSGPTESESLTQIKEGSDLAIAYGTTCLLGRVDRVEQNWQGATEEWHVELQRNDSLLRAGSEMSLAGRSADDIAALRARRILLNEKLPVRKNSDAHNLNDLLLETHIRGQHGSFLSVTESPLPDLFEKSRGHDALTLAAGKLLCVTALTLSKTVERILKFNLSLRDRMLSVEFEGIRARAYQNVEPARIVVTGSLTVK